MLRSYRVQLWFLAFVACLAFAVGATAQAQMTPAPMTDLQQQLLLAAGHAPGRVGIAVEDLATGSITGINAGANLPAASTIKIPVMVEVFKRMQGGNIDLNSVVHLEARDRDWGWGDMADAPLGTPRTVDQLLWLMIANSDNTATNMLIRLVGRVQVNQEMADLGLRNTHLGDYIRSESEAIRYALRTSPSDMVKLLDDIARLRLVDEWSSREMLAILTGQHHNGLLPVPLPKDVKIAHKTGSLHDTLNDVGIVYHDQEPYIIAVMTTQLPDLDSGRAFIHKVSRLAFDELSRVAAWREEAGIPAFAMNDDIDVQASAQVAAPPPSPDVKMWDSSKAPLLTPGEGAAADRDPPTSDY